MSNKKTHSDWQTRKEIGKAGYHLKGQEVRFHNKNETHLHAVVKCLVCKLISEAGRSWSCEVPIGDKSDPIGYVDCLDLGGIDRDPVAIEVESNSSPQVEAEKREKYTVGPIRECLVLDLGELGDDPTVSEITSWLKTELPAVE